MPIHEREQRCSAAHHDRRLTPAMGKPVLADNETPEEVLVALGDDAEGAVGSTAPPETGGVDTGGSAPPETR